MKKISKAARVGHHLRVQGGPAKAGLQQSQRLINRLSHKSDSEEVKAQLEFDNNQNY